MASRPLRAVIYVRLSVHRGEADPSVSPGAQEERGRAYAAAKGWEVVEVIRDLDVSGSDKGLRLDRPGLVQVRALLPEVDVVIFAKLDRLARNVIDFRAFAEEAEEHGVALVSVAESLDLSTPSGRFVSTILAAFAEMEAATIATRVREARGALATLGRYGGGTVAYGYRSAPHPSGAGRILEPDPVEAAILADLAERVAAGESLTSLARGLNARGVPTRRGGSWHPSTLADTLRSGSLVGRLTHRGEVVRDEHGLPVQAWEPALDPALWRAARAALDSRTPIPSNGRRRASRLLSGLTYCGSCNSKMHLRYFAAGPTYACTAKSQGRSCPRGVTIRAEGFEEAVAEEFLSIVGRWPLYVMEAAADDLALSRLADTEEALDRVMVALRSVEDEDEEADLLAQRRTLRGSLESLRSAAEVTQPRLAATGLTYAQEWDVRDTIGRRTLLTSALDGVVVHPTVGRKPDPHRFDLLWTPDTPEADL